jgi:hypothetical protein
MKLNECEIKIFLKCVEELNELSTELIQQINKPHKNKKKNIISEIADVECVIKKLKDILK